ncbi:hypothetical protein MXB_3140 [Myxobolus squamalis]|nr:hypothetical protein MXB_3140 [Myxobolus squamalis]
MPCESDIPAFFKLPLNVIPREYDLKFSPCISKKTFDGIVIISLDVEIPTRKIFMHSFDLLLSKVKLVQDLQGKLVIFLNLEKICVQIEYIKIDEIFCLHFSEELNLGRAELTIKFSGKLQNNMIGLYLTSYLDSHKKLHECLATQFEAADARRAFPCFDEPCFKATFKIKIVYETHKTVLSNMDLETLTLVGDGIAEYSFCVTPKMSTYLVAIVIGDFDRISSSTKSGTRVSIFMPVDKVRTGLHALTAAQKLVEFYNEYFKIPYPIPKLDIISLPDIACGIKTACHA